MTVFGTQNPASAAGEYNAMVFVIQQLLGKLATVTLVRVVAVSNAGGVSPVGTVDVLPLINQMTGNRQAVPHGTLYKVPYARLQGGANAVILDPQVGDIGACMFCSRDISSVVAARSGPKNPGSLRQYDWSDGLYIGGFLNAEPTQYVQFAAEGVSIVSPTKVTLQAPTIELKGDVAQSGGNVTATGSVTAQGDVVGEGISLHDHVHSGVQSGGSNSGPPVP